VNLEKLMSLYRAISSIAVEDGEHSCFWSEDWLRDDALKTRFPALFSHATKPDAFVAVVLHTWIRACLGPCLTTVGEREPVAIEARLAAVSLNSTPNLRALTRCRKSYSDLSVSELYKL
jgi:hypothetical protein